MGMRFRPRFTLRTLLIAIVLLSVPMAWTTYRLNWIRQRHEFLRRDGVSYSYPGFGARLPAPWSLRLFGEPSQARVTTMTVDAGRAQSLFPEAMVLTRD